MYLEVLLFLHSIVYSITENESHFVTSCEGQKKEIEKSFDVF